MLVESRESKSATVQSANEDHLVPVLQDIVAFTFEFPIAVVDQNENAWATVMKEKHQEKGSAL